MASVIGHALGAVAGWEAARRGEGWVPAGRRWYLAPALLGMLPDLDVIVAIVLGPAGDVVHRGPSHSLVVGAGLALVVAGACRAAGARRVAFWRLLLVLFGCAAIHPVLDYLMGCGPPVPFFWPFSDRGFLSPVQLIPTAYYARSPAGLVALVFSPRTWAGVLLELLILGGAWYALHTDRIRRRLLALGASAAGLLTTWIIYN